MNHEPITLFKKSHTGSINVWTARVDGNIIYTSWGKLNGVMQKQSYTIERNQSGRTMDEQIQLQLQGMERGRRDQGYVSTLEEAERSDVTNQVNLILPMQAQLEKAPYERAIAGRMIFQPKLNGHRCMIAKRDGAWAAYSRNGKPIMTIPHVLKALRKTKLQDGHILDGELYTHGASLQEISSAVKRKSKKSKKLVYVVFDMVFTGKLTEPYGIRYQKLKERLTGQPHALPINRLLEGNLKRQMKVMNRRLDNHIKEYEIEGLLTAAINAGYEGLIARNPMAAYEPGKRSRHMVKIKRFYDAEYKVRDITEDRNGYGILHLHHEGKPFRCTAPGNQDDKWDVADNPHNYIDQYVTVKYAEITPHGVPFHPVATHWREDHL